MTTAIRISNRPPGDPDPDRWERPYEPGVVYQITDEVPKLHIGLPTKLKGDHSVQSPGKLELGKHENGLHWYAWIPLAKISTDRRYGQFETTLFTPAAHHFACYLWPERLFERAQLFRVMEDIEAELRQSVLWDSSPHAARAWVDRVESWSNAAGPRLLDALEKVELPAARALLAQPEAGRSWSEGKMLGLRRNGSPERRLLTAWATRRTRQLGDWRDELERCCRDATQQVEVRAGNPMAQERNRAQLSRHMQQLDHAQRVLGTLGGLRLLHGLTDPVLTFELTPSMQRDHRLRRLLAAFAPPPSERWVDREAALSSLPPIRATDLFELWGAIQVVRALRQIGWHGPAPQILGAAPGGQIAPLGCRWRLTRGDWTLVFEHAPDVLHRGHGPSVEQRSADRLTWAMEGVDDDHLFSNFRLEPDYAIRLYGPNGVSLAIGDASLADPKHQEGDKVGTIARYREQVGWRTPAGHLCRVHPIGLFLTLPGPAALWTDTELPQKAAEWDCRVLYARPGAPPAELVDPVGHLIETLVRATSA